MASRRIEKTDKLIRSTVSEIIANQLADPRITGLISVTRVESAPDLRSAKVYLSILGGNEKKDRLSILAIQHASGFIQSKLAGKLAMKTCPTLKFLLDEALKEGCKIAQLIEQTRMRKNEQEEKQQQNLEQSNEG